MKRHLNLLLILLVPTLLWIACWPFVDSPVNDDFSYAFTTKGLLETGRLTYNGWSSPILGPHALWGAMFAKAFGFSHDVLRWSMLPISIACSVLAYALHRRMSLSPALSLFGTLLLVGSPLYIPWAASFMTDVSGLLFTLLLFHCLIGVVRSERMLHTLLWAIATAVVALLGGAIRQSVLLLGLVTIGVALIKYRKHTGGAAGLTAIILAYCLTAYALVQWQQAQPYSLMEPWPTIAQLWSDGVLLMFGLFLQSGIYLLPLAPVWVRWSGLRWWAIGLLALVMVCLAFGIYHSAPTSFPARLFQGMWVGNTFTPTGLLETNVDTPGQRPTVFANPVRLLLGAAVYVQIVLAVVVVVRKRQWLIERYRRLRTEAWPERTWIFGGMIAMALAYAALLFPRAALKIVFDRYLLVLLPIVTIFVLYVAQKRSGPKLVSPVAWVLVGLYALIAVGGTFDHFVELRVREVIASQLLREGAVRTKISNGVAYDGWTQLHATGYMNNPLVLNPPDAFVDFPALRRNRELYWFLRYTPAIEPRQIIINWPSEPQVPEGVPVYSFRTVLPPFQRWLTVWSPLDPPPTTAPGTEPSTR